MGGWHSTHYEPYFPFAAVSYSMSPSASALILTFYGYQTPPTFQRRGSVVVLSGSVSLVETIVPTSGPRAPSLSSLILPLSGQEDSPCLKAIARSGFCKGAEKLVPSIAARSHQPPILPSFQHDNLLCSMPIAPRRQKWRTKIFRSQAVHDLRNSVHKKKANRSRRQANC